MKEFIRKSYKLLEIIFLFFLSLTPILWLKGNYIILGHDSGFRLDPVQHLINLFYSWDPSSNFGQDWSLYKGFIMAQAPEAFFITLTKSITTGQELTFILWFFIMGCSMYVFTNVFFPEKKFWILRIFGSSLYMFNFFVLQAWFIAERAKFSVLAALPLGILILYKTLTKEYSILKGAILFSLTSFLLNGGGNPTFYASLLLAYGITFIFLTYINIRKDGYKEIFYSFKLVLFFIVGFLTINAYFVLPQMYHLLVEYVSGLRSVGGIVGILEWESVISENASFINLFRLEGIPDWGNKFHVYSSLFTTSPFLITLSFIFPLILFFGLLNHDKLTDQRKNKVFFLVLIFLLVSLPFTAGSHPPFGFIYTFFIKYLPGFPIFRSAFYKFGELLWFSYIFLVAFYLNFFLLRYINKKSLYVLLGLLSVLFVLAYHSPFFKSDFFLWGKPFTTKVELPNYVNEMRYYINTLPLETRILLLPVFDIRSADSYKWGFWSLDSLPRLFTNKSIISSSGDGETIANFLSKAISENNEQAFLQVAKLVGINKILWRDDILYSDKKTNGSFFLQEKNNLENFKGIVLEKETGPWSLYSFSSSNSNPLFYVPENLINFYSKNSSPFDFYKDVALQPNNALILSENSSLQGLTGLVPFYNFQVMQADCILCKPFELKKLEQRVIIPAIKVLPNSPFYNFVSSKEEKEKKLYSGQPLQRIHFDIAIANKRIAEVVQIAERDFDKEKSEELMIRQIRQYQSLMDDAMQQSNFIPQNSKNTALIQILSYFDVQYQSLVKIYNKHRFIEEELDKVSIYMQNNISNLRKIVWMTSLNLDKFAYLIDVEAEGNYDLIIKDSPTSPLKIEIDGREVSSLTNIHFSSGVHKLSLTYPFENLLKNDSKQEDFTLDFNESAKFGIKNFQKQNTYLIYFDYRVAYGKPKFSILEEGRNKEDKIVKMGGSNKWDKFTYIYNPSQGTSTPVLKVSPFIYDIEGTSLKIRNFIVLKSFTPSLFLQRKIPALQRNNPKLSFERVDPTKFIVRVKGATEPFVLYFGQTFDRGWKASILKSNFDIAFPGDLLNNVFFNKNKDTVSEINHFEIDGYANGWLLQKKGNYNLVIEYSPQRFFYIGLGISILMLVLSVGLIAYIKYEKNR